MKHFAISFITLLFASGAYSFDKSDFIDICAGPTTVPTGCAAPALECVSHDFHGNVMDKGKVVRKNGRANLRGNKLEIFLGVEAAQVCARSQELYCPNQIIETCCIRQCAYFSKQSFPETCFMACIGG